jgi:TM2 domain-containing membrane protein YozV
MTRKKQRRLVSIMFTDIVGYSRIMQEDEQKGIAVRNLHKKVFEEMTDEYDGQLLQYFGDGTLSIFNSSTDAVECAIEMQRKFQKDPIVPLRIGIHTGEIIFNEDDAFGHGLNVAARIEPICIPGGVYLTGKVQEDINNHPWIQTRSQGLYELKNINEAVEVFAVYNEGIVAPELNKIQIPGPKYKRAKLEDEKVLTSIKEPEPQIKGHKKRIVAAILALLLGIFGVHRHYLNQRKLGIVYFVSFMLGIMSEGDAWFLIVIPAIVGLLDSVLLFSMSNAEFDLKYNNIQTTGPTVKQVVQQKEELIEEEFDWQEEEYEEEPELLSMADKAARAVRKGNYNDAIEYYNYLLEDDPENKQLHFSLAVCYSMSQDAKDGFYHLGKAVEFGFDDFQKIKNHFTLAYLRSRKEFESFENQGYRLVSMLPSPQENLLDTETPLLLKKLEKLEILGEKLDKGEISEKQFAKQKEKLLNN